jgi:hypothetical protein
MGGPGAVNPSATEFCEKHGIQVVEGGCPYMFMTGSAWFHRLHGVVLKIVGKYPK